MYREKMNYENLNKRIFVGEGEFNIPLIQCQDIDIEGVELIGFNFAKTTKDRADKAVHFFIDDYQFNRVWNSPDVYVDMLRQFRFICTPDFSTYTDFPKAIQIYNHYRKQWVGAYYQSKGINVIPTISWSDESSFEWCFDGVPRDGIAAISSVGTQQNKRVKELFLIGYNKMLKVLKPKIILFYGAVPEECKGNIVRLQAFQDSIKSRCRKEE